MLLTTLLAAALQAAAPAAAPVAAPPVKPVCRRPSVDYAAAPAVDPAPDHVRPLGDEPAARNYLSVMRLEDGCDKLVPVAGEPHDPPAPWRAR